MIFTILGWAIYGLIVGLLGKLLVSYFVPDAPNEVPNVGPTILVGIIGSYVGGFVEFLIYGGMAFSASGIILGTIGAAIALAIYHFVNLKLKK